MKQRWRQVAACLHRDLWGADAGSGGRPSSGSDVTAKTLLRRALRPGRAH